VTIYSLVRENICW